MSRPMALKANVTKRFQLSPEMWKNRELLHSTTICLVTHKKLPSLVSEMAC